MGLEIIDEIKRKAERTGYSVEELFEQAGVDYGNFRRWEKGETSPTWRTLQALFNVPSRAEAEQATKQLKRLVTGEAK